MNVQERHVLVREFCRLAGEPVNDAPAPPSPREAVLRASFILEEVFELFAALGVRVVVREATGPDGLFCDASVVDYSDLQVEATGAQPNLVEITDALRDLEYHIYGTELSLGVHDASDATFLEVHRSNMEKRFGCGGDKAVKPKDWKPPAIRDILRKMFPKKALLFR